MRRKFSREFKLEAVKLVRERGVSVAQACRDLDVAESVARGAGCGSWRRRRPAPSLVRGSSGRSRQRLRP